MVNMPLATMQLLRLGRMELFPTHRKDGIVPHTVEKLEWTAINGKVIEEYIDRKRVLIYAELKEEKLPVHIVVDYSFCEEPVIVTSYVPDSKYWIKYKIRKKIKG